MYKLFFPLVLLLTTAAGAQNTFTAAADAFFKSHVTDGRVDYAALARNGVELDKLTEQVATTELASLTGDDRKAFLINAYNLLVIDQAAAAYPLKSVLDQGGFFDGNKFTVAGRKLTLNELEKGLLLKEFPDARLHFVLVCGALGCPPITDFAYAADKLDAQLDRQTRRALNDPQFIRVDGNQVELSQIFEWYAGDFGGSKKETVAFINQYRDTPLPADAQLSYYTYDWTLNATAAASLGSRDPGAPAGANNAARYVVSSTIAPGTFEIKVFNNLYRQDDMQERASFFTTTVSALYGLTPRFNVGLETRLRRAGYTPLMGEGGAASRAGLTGIGPKIRVAPFGGLPNFSVQSSLTFPVGQDLTGGATGQRFLDWSGPVSWTQFFNDVSIGRDFSLFTEIDLLVEDIGSSEAGRLNRVSTPVTGIFSYFPTPKATLYALANYSPFWQAEFDYFYQFGGGVKYQFTPNFELELLATAFDNAFLSRVGGSASTLNLGVRFNI